jgi:MtN3 and saliva related transmembrane protein
MGASLRQTADAMMLGFGHPHPYPLAMTNPDINLTEWIGYVAATLTTCSFVPQAILILRTRNVVGISVGMYWAFTTGVALWLLYGWQLQAWPIIIANAITVVLAATILITKIVVERNLKQARLERHARRQPLDAVQDEGSAPAVKEL